MDSAMAATASRTLLLSRLLVAPALALGMMAAPEVGASKAGKNTIESIT
jgi:hypothetical protein